MTTELVTAETYDFASATDLAAIWAEEGVTPEFPRIKTPAGGSTTFEVDEDVDPTRELRGVIVHWHAASRLYLESFEDSDDSSRRPDAWSLDGVVQVVPSETHAKIEALNVQRAADGKPLLPTPLADLAQCPYNKFAGDFASQTTPLGKTRGKDNNETRELYIVLADAETIVPYHLSIPPSSLKNWNGKGGYLPALVTKGGRLAKVETIITLEKVKGAGSIEYGVYNFAKATDRKLAPDVAAASAEFAAGIKTFLTGGATAGNLLAAAPAPAPALEAGAGVPAEVPAVAPQAAAAAVEPELEPVAAGGVDDDLAF